MREFWFESEATPLFAVEGGEGPVLVMLHGALANHQRVLPLIAPYGSRFRIVAPDLRCSGRSHSGDRLSLARLAADLRSLHLPVLLVRGDDPLHPPEVSDLYAANLSDCTEVASSADASAAIGTFCDSLVHTV